MQIFCYKGLGFLFGWFWVLVLVLFFERFLVCFLLFLCFFGFFVFFCCLFLGGLGLFGLGVFSVCFSEGFGGFFSPNLLSPWGFG